MGDWRWEVAAVEWSNWARLVGGKMQLELETRQKVMGVGQGVKNQPKSGFQENRQQWVLCFQEQFPEVDKSRRIGQTDSMTSGTIGVR